MIFKNRFSGILCLNCLVLWLLNGLATASEALFLIPTEQYIEKSADNHSQVYDPGELHPKPLSDCEFSCESAKPLTADCPPFVQWTQRRDGFQGNGSSQFNMAIPDFKQFSGDSPHAEYPGISSVVIVSESLVEAKENIAVREEPAKNLETKSGYQSAQSMLRENNLAEAKSEVMLELQIKPTPVVRQSERSGLQTHLNHPSEIGSISGLPVTNAKENRVAGGPLSPALHSSDQSLRDSNESEKKIPAYHSKTGRQLQSDFVSVNVDEIHDRINERGELLFGRNPNLNYGINAHRLDRLKSTIEGALKFYHNKPEDASIRTHWGMMHQIMIFGSDTLIIDRNKKYNAISWMAGNNQCRNQLLFGIDNGGLFVKSGVGLQGHQGQFLAILGQIDVPLEYPIYVGRNKYSVEDIVRREMLDCKADSELTFVLIGLSHYKDSDASWNSRDGQLWNVEKLIAEELRQPILGAACGGTHRLMGLGHSLRRRRAERKSMSGEWQRAEKFVTDFIQYTWSLQNRDGSMSSAWFERPQDNGSIDRKVQTTGHILEMLMVVSSDEDLCSPKMLSAVEFVADAMFKERDNDWEVGPKGHALRALAMFYHRAFGDQSPWRLKGEIRNTRGTNFSAGGNKVR